MYNIQLGQRGVSMASPSRDGTRINKSSLPPLEATMTLFPGPDDVGLHVHVHILFLGCIPVDTWGEVRRDFFRTNNEAE